MKAFWSFLIGASTTFCGFCDTVVVPQDRANQAGNGQWVGGIAIPSDPYTQTVYGSKNFSGPVEITGVAFRPDENSSVFGSGSFDVVIPSFELRLTTYTGTPQSMSSVYGQNKGADDTQVFSGGLHWTLQDLPGSVPNLFSMSIPFTTPFVYDPSKGDLLMAFASSGPSTGGVAADLHGHGNYTIGWTYEGGSAVGDNIVTQFTYQSVPEPSALMLIGAFGLPLLRRMRRK
jgi:hypothetical protein